MIMFVLRLNIRSFWLRLNLNYFIEFFMKRISRDECWMQTERISQDFLSSKSALSSSSSFKLKFDFQTTNLFLLSLFSKERLLIGWQNLNFVRFSTVVVAFSFSFISKISFIYFVEDRFCLNSCFFRQFRFPFKVQLKRFFIFSFSLFTFLSVNFPFNEKNKKKLSKLFILLLANKCCKCF